MEHSFGEILREHRNKYPLMEPQDYGKLIFQSVFGPEHMVANRQMVWEYMVEEFSGMAQDALPRVPEDIGNGLCRFPLCACSSMEAAELLTDLFVLTAKEGGGTSAEEKSRLLEELRDKLEQVKALGIPGMEAWVQQWREKGYPAVHHSKVYNEAYHPHYRLLRKEYAIYFPVLWEIYKLIMKDNDCKVQEQKVVSGQEQEKASDRKQDTVSEQEQETASGRKQDTVSGQEQEKVSGQEQEKVSGRKQDTVSGPEQETESGQEQETESGWKQGTVSCREQDERQEKQYKRPIIIGIDGRCGSGKTSLAKLIAGIFPCNVIHMDDFYLPMGERAENWTEVPGGNMNFARLRSEILIPAQSGEEVFYRPYHCQEGVYGEALQLAPCQLVIVEGSYSHHPLLADAYHLKVFLTCSKEVQTKRLQEREGSYFNMFEKRWIPMEENYFQHFHVEAGSDLVVETDEIMLGKMTSL